ncbi:hypothetical protein HAHE_03210 [Haloferula helveola]|uniref:DNA primase n=1 Tax=Haloferula helveola TaxID=490095 RepID=A0ABM7R700_9BACT|nr:hypothetical protein HAHE_03210 [Haloferula helveola]
MPLDLALLEKVRHHPSGKITARCPACAEDGGDRTGNHLAVFTDERFACAACPGDGEHRQRIHTIAGIKADFQPDPTQRRQYHARRATARRHKLEADRLADTARKYRQELVECYAWKLPDLWDDSPQRIDCDRVGTCPRHFLATLLPPHSILWTGEVHHSGKPEHAAHWRTCDEWLHAGDPIGPMTTPATWKTGIHSRSGDNVASAPFTVLDFDGFDGIKPRTGDEHRAHLRASLALTRWLREFLHWQLAAILHTGGKSLHVWFHNPGPIALDSLRHTSAPLGIDAGLIGRPEHPCRLPGQIHAGTGRSSRVLWLQNPASAAP